MRFVNRAVLIFLLVLGAFLLIGCSEKTTGPENPPVENFTVSIVGWGSQVVVEQTALDDLVAIAGGSLHSVGLKGDGTIVAWGENNEGQCNVPSPNEGFIAVAGGFAHNLGLRSHP